MIHMINKSKCDLLNQFSKDLYQNTQKYLFDIMSNNTLSALEYEVKKLNAMLLSTQNLEFCVSIKGEVYTYTFDIYGVYTTTLFGKKYFNLQDWIQS